MRQPCTESVAAHRPHPCPHCGAVMTDADGCEPCRLAPEVLARRRPCADRRLVHAIARAGHRRQRRQVTP